MTAAPVLRPPSTVCTSMEGLWILTMLLIRPGTALLRLYCSASRTRSFLSKGESAEYSGTTTPPGRIGCGAYGASLVGPGFGAPKAGGRGGSAPAGEVSADSQVTAARTVSTSQSAIESGCCMETHFGLPVPG